MKRYKCEYCDLEVDPRMSSVLHLITGWAKGSTNNVKIVDVNHRRYAHDFCMPRATEDQPSLF